MLEYIGIKGTNLVSSRIALGTWAIGGWMWGGTDEKESIRTIHAAFDQGVNLSDTAPVYGFGRSEEIVGEALRQRGRRDSIILATKVGLVPDNAHPRDRLQHLVGRVASGPLNELHACHSFRGPEFMAPPARESAEPVTVSVG
jgi:aryl-alcohol dehydrogenase-like predicted oxidoreductase